MERDSPFKIDSLDGYQFEDLIAKIMKKKGYEKILVTSKSNDMGKDIIMEDSRGQIILVECKHQKFVGRPVIQKLQGAMNFEETRNPDKVIEGIIVTSGKFSREATEYNQKIGQNIELIDGRKLKEMCRKLKIFILNGKVQIITNQSFLNVSNDKMKEITLKEYEKIYGSKFNNPKIQSKVEFIPACFLTYEVSFDTHTSVGCVDSYSKTGKIAVNGITGEDIDEEVSDFYFTGGIETEEIDKALVRKRPPYEFTENDIEDYAITSITEEHTHDTNYVGNNNVSYTKKCTPKKRDIDIKKFISLYLPFWSNKIKILDMTYEQNLYVKDQKQHYIEDELRKCKICNNEEDDYEDLNLCPECGRIVCKNHVKIDYLDKKTPICTIHAKELKLFIQKKYFATKVNKKKYQVWWKSRNFFQRLWEDKIAFWLSIIGIILIPIFISAAIS